MASLIPGYEYDIFISYRHKDNHYDGWVTEFVTNFTKELESTFKQKVSIYFDENRQDGLHETDDVDESLKNKIKCLVFIPIVSRTFCDPDCFAWKNEMLKFRDFAKGDTYGLKVKVANGNVSHRILPVRIHDLDDEDVKTFEREVCGIMRPVDFVFNATGVNRPLRAHEDEPRENKNHIYYRDQINKLANAVRVIVAAMQHQGEERPEPQPCEAQHHHLRKTASVKFMIPLLAALLLYSVCYDVCIFLKGTGIESSEHSIAVLSFADMSENGDQQYFSDGLSEELLNLLATIPGLRVISRTSAFSFKGKSEDIRTIGEKLGVGYLLEGSVRKSDNKIRITAQLIRASDGAHVWSETFDRDLNEIFKVQAEVAHDVVKEIRIKFLSNELLTEKR